jgi:hypothetical protein
MIYYYLLSNKYYLLLNKHNLLIHEKDLKNKMQEEKELTAHLMGEILK